MYVENCVALLERVLAAMTKDEREYVVSEYVKGNLSEVRAVLERKGVQKVCLSISDIKVAFSKYIDSAKVDRITLVARLQNQKFHCYTPVEIIYAYIYGVSHKPHEDMHAILEPVVLGNARLEEKRALFTYPTKGTWGFVESVLLKLASSNKIVCEAICTYFDLLFSCYDTGVKATFIEVPVSQALLNLCSCLYRYAR